jgi:hypothetical protein
LIRLPVPPSFLGRRRGDPASYFCSPSANLAGENAPEVDPALVAQAEPELSTGVIVFDIWVANSDRHAGNLRFQVRREGVRLDVFDHSHALFREADSLTLHVGHLGITGVRREHNRHCLLDELQTDSYLRKWVNRVRDVRDELIDEILTEAVRLGLPRTLTVDGSRFLRERKGDLEQLIKRHRHEFTGIEQWSLEWSA